MIENARARRVRRLQEHPKGREGGDGGRAASKNPCKKKLEAGPEKKTLRINGAIFNGGGLAVHVGLAATCSTGSGEEKGERNLEGGVKKSKMTESESKRSQIEPSISRRT